MEEVEVDSTIVVEDIVELALELEINKWLFSALICGVFSRVKLVKHLCKSNFQVKKKVIFGTDCIYY